MNKIMKKQFDYMYKRKGFKGINEFCVLSGVSLVSAYAYVSEFEEDQEIIDKCNTKVIELKKFYGDK